VRAWWATLGKGWRFTVALAVSVGLGAMVSTLTKVQEFCAFVLEHSMHVDACQTGQRPTLHAPFLLTAGITTVLLTGVFLTFIGGFLAIDRTHAVRGRKLTISNAIDAQGTTIATVRYEGVESIHKNVILPVTVALPTAADPDVKTTGLEITSVKKHKTVPPLPSQGNWDGVVTFDDRGPHDVMFTYTFHKNCALDAATFRARWNQQEAIDDLEVEPHLYWKEIQIDISWAQAPALKSEPYVVVKESRSANEEKRLPDALKKFGPKAWTITLKNVEPRKYIAIRWELQ
jgi:hypothetical protein